MSHPIPIPNAALDDRLGIVGTAGSGKTFTSMLLEERILDRKGRIIHIDPLGVAWGLRLMADGKKKSPYNIVIFGGPHGDLPLTEHAGALIGETVATMAESCIIDLSQLGTKASERRFMLAFTTALYKNASGEPVHLIFDEVDMFAPQKLLDKDGDAARLLGMMETIVRRGRRLGFIPWLISQRPAVINKDILSQVDGLIAMKLTASQDRKALGAWIEGQADVEEGKKILADLPTKQVGEGVVWIPGRSILKTVQFPEKLTFDSSRAPKRGERVRKTAQLDRLDITELQDKLKAVEIEVKANDPRALKGKVAELTATIAKLEKTAATAKPIKPTKDTIALAETRGIERGQKAAVAAAEKTIKSLRTALEAAMKFIVEINAKDFFKAGGEAVDKKAVEKAITDATQEVTKLIERHFDGRNRELDALRKEAQRLAARLKALIEQADKDVTVQVAVQHNKPFTISDASPPARQPQLRAVPSPPVGDGSFNVPQSKVLRSLAMWRSLGHEQPTREMVAAIAGYKPSTGNYGNLIGGLVTMGAVGKPAQGRLSLLADGVDVMSQDEGRAMLIDTLNGPQRRVVAALIDAGAKTREQLAQDTGYQPGTGNYGNLLGSLNTIGVTVKPAQGQIALSDWAQELLTGYAERIAA